MGISSRQIYQTSASTLVENCFSLWRRRVSAVPVAAVSISRSRFYRKIDRRRAKESIIYARVQSGRRFSDTRSCTRRRSRRGERHPGENATFRYRPELLPKTALEARPLSLRPFALRPPSPSLSLSLSRARARIEEELNISALANNFW